VTADEPRPARHERAHQSFSRTASATSDVPTAAGSSRVGFMS
jgi:hypothetical protein